MERRNAERRGCLVHGACQGSPGIRSCTIDSISATGGHIVTSAEFRPPVGRRVVLTVMPFRGLPMVSLEARVVGHRETGVALAWQRASSSGSAEFLIAALEDLFRTPVHHVRRGGGRSEWHADAAQMPLREPTFA